MVRGKTHQEYATYFICSYPTFKHNSGIGLSHLYVLILTALLPAQGILVRTY